jgi:hypothetical protein
MGFTHGKSAVVKMDNSANALTAITSYVDEATFPQTADANETTTFGAGSKTFIAGLGDSKITLKGKFDGTVGAAVQDQMFAATFAAQQAGTLASVSFEFNPAGVATGAPKYSVEGIITHYEVSVPVHDVVSWSLEAQGSGPSVRTTN